MSGAVSWRSRWNVLATACVIVLAVASGAAAAPYTADPPTVASPGPSPFLGCTADNPTGQQQFSILYPNAEPEPRATINPTDSLNIVGEYQQDRWDNGGGRGLVVSVSKDGGGSWHRVVVPGT